MLGRKTAYSTFLEKAEQVLKRIFATDYLLLLKDFTAHVGNDRDTWKSMIR